MSLYTSSSNFRFLSQGVAAAIQKRHLPVGPACAVTAHAEAPARSPTAPTAATAPKPSRNVLRVVSIVYLLSRLSRPTTHGSLRQAIREMQSEHGPLRLPGYAVPTVADRVMIFVESLRRDADRLFPRARVECCRAGIRYIFRVATFACVD